MWISAVTPLLHPCEDRRTALDIDRWRPSRRFILRRMTEDSIFHPSPSLYDTLLSSTHDTQTCFKDIEPHHPNGREEQGNKEASCSTSVIIPNSLRSPTALPTPEPSLSSWRSPLREDAAGIAAGQADSPWTWSPTGSTDAEPVTAIDATDIRDSSKRTADKAGLNDGGESTHRLEKVRCAGECVGLYYRGRV